ncbi:chain-length determining protein [Mastigocoleus testarum BC008]|uniref:non-specific protein-tyrosine kinase n=2 Tax=Mastigocoleus TaxID=996924 RepID=A0A0V7ZNJ9_9CYAN|nr:chain-length determining protein [Mastigocoleus testarum BC008]
MTSSPQVEREDTDYIDLEQYWLILKRRWVPASVVAGSVVGLAALVTFMQKPIYEAKAELLFNKQSNVSSLTGLSGAVGELSGITNLSNPLETEAKVIRSNPIIQKTIDKFNLRDDDNEPISIEDFLKQLKVKSAKGTDVLEISYKGTDPQQAAAIVNSLMQDYIDNNIRVNTAEARAAREFLNNQLPEVESRVVKAEAELRKFKEENKVVALKEEAQFGVEGLKDSLQELNQAEAKLAAANERSQALQRELDIEKQKAVELSELSQSPAVQQALQEYQKVQDRLAVARTRLTNQHPTVIDLSNKERALRNQLEKRVGQVVNNNSNDSSITEDNLQVGEIKQTLTSELLKSEVERLAVAKQVGVLRKAFALQQARLTVLPKLEQQQRQVERKLQIAQLTYQNLLKKLQEVQVIENQNIGNARIISEALVPDKKISPRIALNLLLGGFLGILLGAGTALILETMDKSLKTVDQAKRLLNYPVLGTIPQFEGKGFDGNPELPTLNNPYSVESSAFEMLQTNLSFTSSDKTLKVLMVTSSVPGEGKSLVSANLAVTISQFGQRVLLIDGDMRRPRQHKLWKIHSFSGLSNLLVGKAELQNSIQKPLATLDLLPAGKIPPNPGALVDSQSMVSLLEEAKKEYDFIIIDTPPLTAAADSLIFSKLVDGTLLVVRPGIATSDAVSAAKNQLEQSGQRVLGMALNGINRDSQYGGYYGQSYYGNNIKEKVSV